MNILDVSIIIFIIMESANVLILYFAPDSKYGNGVAVFNHWFKAKEDESLELFVKYLTNWVAGVKLIFIVLLIVILFTANPLTKILAVLVIILSISTYYFRLNPIIKKLDKLGEITPKNYSKTLFMMITSFMLMFSLALISYFLL